MKKLFDTDIELYQGYRITKLSQNDIGKINDLYCHMLKTGKLHDLRIGKVDFENKNVDVWGIMDNDRLLAMMEVRNTVPKYGINEPIIDSLIAKQKVSTVMFIYLVISGTKGCGGVLIKWLKDKANRENKKIILESINKNMVEYYKTHGYKLIYDKNNRYILSS